MFHMPEWQRPVYLIRHDPHAWIGILVGGLFGLIWTVLTVVVIVGALTG